jgi:hypothetical protein
VAWQVKSLMSSTSSSWLWLVGEHSLVTSLVMGVDTYPLLVKFRSMEKATKEMIKLGKWLDKIQK